MHGVWWDGALGCICFCCVRQDIAERIKAMTGGDEREIQCKTSYILNSVWERGVVDRAADIVRSDARIVSFEYDGLVVLPHGQGLAMPAWEAEVLSLVREVGNFKIKPYRTTEQLPCMCA